MGLGSGYQGNNQALSRAAAPGGWGPRVLAGSAQGPRRVRGDGGRALECASQVCSALARRAASDFTFPKCTAPVRSVQWGTPNALFPQHGLAPALTYGGGHRTGSGEGRGPKHGASRSEPCERNGDARRVFGGGACLPVHPEAGLVRSRARPPEYTDDRRVFALRGASVGASHLAGPKLRFEVRLGGQPGGVCYVFMWGFWKKQQSNKTAGCLHGWRKSGSEASWG